MFDLKQPQNQSNEPDLTSFVVVPNKALVAASMFAEALKEAATKDGKPHWVKFNGFRIPKDAIVGGYTGHENLYIGRALHSNAMTPGTRLVSFHSLTCKFNSTIFRNCHTLKKFFILGLGLSY